LTETLLDKIQKLPKIELHRHLEGAMRIDTLLEVARHNDHELADLTLEQLRPYVQMVPGQPFTAKEFLGKFKVLRQFYNSPETIRRIAREAVIDAANDNIRYMELRFTPKALTNVLQCSYADVMDWVCDTVRNTATQHDIDVRLIVSMNRHESVSIGEEVLDIALAYQHRGVVGIDLAGAEADYAGKPFTAIFQRARAHGLFTTVHAGEWGGAANVREAVEVLQADRIGHGIRAIEDQTLVTLLAQRGIVLEVCPTSNLHSGVAVDLNQHPLIDLYRAGVHTTINTDDPLISNITLTTELLDVMFNMKFTLEDIQQNILHSVQGAFLPDAERDALQKRFQMWFSQQQEQDS
jgi:adenosine deaminase